MPAPNCNLLSTTHGQPENLPLFGFPSWGLHAIDILPTPTPALTSAHPTAFQATHMNPWHDECIIYCGFMRNDPLADGRSTPKVGAGSTE
jgi:hypothetical protein